MLEWLTINLTRHNDMVLCCSTRGRVTMSDGCKLLDHSFARIGRLKVSRVIRSLKAFQIGTWNTQQNTGIWNLLGMLSKKQRRRLLKKSYWTWPMLPLRAGFSCHFSRLGTPSTPSPTKALKGIKGIATLHFGGVWSQQIMKWRWGRSFSSPGFQFLGWHETSN